ncbi:MAG: Rpn family recombination-promoting nuclease/putative transposase [Bacteroidales bacterium]|nr:Rpn family recombination-promoting nuclease/putative transposase [Candidatus Sodaliphilus limicaballi]
MATKTLIRFDWAMKRMLRDKANFGVLEGLITTLLSKNIHIVKLLESESNMEDDNDKQNRVDILAEDDKGELFIIEVQNESEFAYFQRMLFGTSKLVTEYINRGQGYENIRKIYSINIVYFKLGNGTDYVYHGKTEFRGMHNGELLTLSGFQQQKFQVSEVSELYPEYYILKVNDFNKWSRVPLEQWIYFLNTGEIPEDADAPGLGEAREKLILEHMTKTELEAYYRHLDNIVVLQDNITTARGEGRLEGFYEGREEGRAEGRAEGREEGRAEGEKLGKLKSAKLMVAAGADKNFVIETLNLTLDEAREL